MKDLSSDIVCVALKTAANVTADFYSKYVDLQGYEGCTILLTCTMGTADSSNYITPALYGTNSTSPGTFTNYTAITSSDLNGSFEAMNDTTEYTMQVGYTAGANHYRYLCVFCDETATAVATEISIHAILSHDRHSPASSDTPTTGAVT